MKRKFLHEHIGSPEYLEHRSKMFPNEQIGSLGKNEAFLLSDSATRQRHEEEYNSKAPMYYRDRPAFGDILSGMKHRLSEL